MKKRISIAIDIEVDTSLEYWKVEELIERRIRDIEGCRWISVKVETHGETIIELGKADH